MQAGAGVRWHARPGDTVTEGQPLMTLLTDEPDRFERALAVLEGSFDIEAGRVVRRRADRDRPGGRMTQLSAGESYEVSATEVRMGIGWDQDAGAGVARTGRPEVDLDATALQFAGGTAVRPGVLQQPARPATARSIHHGDNQTGSGEGDDESILVDLARVHGPVDTILFLVSSYQGHSLEWVANAYCRLVDDESGRGAGPVHAHLLGDGDRCGAGAAAAYAVRLGAARGRRGRADHGADAGAGQAAPASSASSSRTTISATQAGLASPSISIDVAGDHLLAGRDVGELGQRRGAADAGRRP